MKNLLIGLLVLIYTQGLCQEINSYEDYPHYKEKNKKRIIELQEKEIKTESDRYAIIKYFDESIEILENLLTKHTNNHSEIILDLIDNYTYCMRKYPDKNDTAKILHYFDKAKCLGLCDYSYYYYIVELRNDKVFQLIKNDSCIRNVLLRYDSEENRWNNNHFKTKFKDNITDKEKIAGLSKFWSEVKYNYAYFDHVPFINWDSLYISYIPKILSTKSTKTYYDTLKVLCAKLNDSHTAVNYPDELNIGRPPVRCKLVEDKVFISEILNDSLLQTGLKAGMEVLKINGIPVKDYANQFIRPFICSSTKQDLLVRTYEYFLFDGKRDEPLLLELKDWNGKKHKFLVNRNLPYNIPFQNNKFLEFKILENNVGYLVLNSFSQSKNVIETFNKIFGQISQTDGLIIDLRNNGGGMSSYGDYIFSCFINKPSHSWKSETLNYKPSIRANGSVPPWYSFENKMIQPSTEMYYDKSIILLTGTRTFSAAEDFCLLFDANKRATIIGETTGGSTGQPLSFDLPGGGKARVCVKRSYYPNGKEFVGYGIQPHIYVKQTISDFQKGKDAVLEKATEYFKNLNRYE